MPPSEFEPTVSASEQPQTYILDFAAPDTGHEEPNCNSSNQSDSTY